MGRQICNLLGRRFSRLEVLSLHSMRDRRAVWLCLCKCGRTTLASTSKLNAGRKKSCGCWLKESRELEGARRFNDLSGRKFGRLRVIDTSHRVRTQRGKRFYWNCLCECGRQAKVDSNSLKSKRVRSCGCLRQEQARQNQRRRHSGLPRVGAERKKKTLSIENARGCGINAISSAARSGDSLRS